MNRAVLAIIVFSIILFTIMFIAVTYVMSLPKTTNSVNASDLCGDCYEVLEREIMAQ